LLQGLCGDVLHRLLHSLWCRHELLLLLLLLLLLHQLRW
jgi:hypothetical protein